ncbi:putative L-3-cyanoalanine synthase [Rosa chinensis]|uniref:Putative L-3-cyanoalanine synthase n=1 Tax=Rosa chinensis TaxID=74649 RepID=A0A2P6S9E7_ROSCH|nr:bifunctional L-3-cyanoalanine synthase/cysteine synthase C1, mitochondrial isoform X2 [Rosa chinensis]PRQ55291.1 putative L-3-cyanoalanine synthase [Rosa chinensis]
MLMLLKLLFCLVCSKLQDLRYGDIFVMGIGSGGTISGVGRYLKSQNLDCKIYGVEPAESNNILNGGKPGPHSITGNGIGFKPNVLDMDIMERLLELLRVCDFADKVFNTSETRIKILLEEAHDWKLSTPCKPIPQSSLWPANT